MKLGPRAMIARNGLGLLALRNLEQPPQFGRGAMMAATNPWPD
jgi:hypothetical protein